MEPVRCITCNGVLHFVRYEELCTDRTTKQALDEMSVHRFCCRRMYISHPKELEELIRTFPLKSFQHDDYSINFGSDVVRVVSTD